MPFIQQPLILNKSGKITGNLFWPLSLTVTNIYFDYLIIRRTANKSINVHHCQQGKDKYKLWFFNDVPINEVNPLVKVNFIYCQQTTLKGQVTNFSWVTSLPINLLNVFDIMKAGRARWKIENEVFNTLKNQGYHFEHNYGHGYENLSAPISMGYAKADA